MKKNLAVLAMIFLLFGSVKSFGQMQLAVGVKGGLNFAKLNTSDFDGTVKGRTGYHFGAFALFKFTKIGIQPEILFSQQGTKVKANTGSFDANFSYITVPVMLKLYTIAGINLQVGPQFGFLSRAEIAGDNAKDAIKKSDLSAAFGAGWDLPFGLTIDARYNLGLKNVNDTGSGSIKNQVFQVSLGYKLIKLGK